MILELNSHVFQQTNDKKDIDVLEMKDVFLPEMSGELIPTYISNGKRILPFWIEVVKVN